MGHLYHGYVKWPGGTMVLQRLHRDIPWHAGWSLQFQPLQPFQEKLEMTILGKYPTICIHMPKMRISTWFHMFHMFHFPTFKVWPFLGWFPANLRKKARSWQGRICMPKNAHKKSFSDHNCGCNEPSSTTMSLWEFRNPQVMIQIPSLCSSKVSEPNHPFPWSESKRGQHQMSTPL